MLAFNDIYFLLTAVMLVMIPSFLFLRGPKTTDGAGPQGELINCAPFKCKRRGCVV